MLNRAVFLGIGHFAIKISYAMPLHFDIEKDTLYRKGFERGLEIAFEKIRAEQREAYERLAITNMIKILQLDDTSIAATVGLTSDFVSKIRKELGL